MTVKRGIAAAFVLCALALPAVAAAALVGPKPGHWRISGGGGFSVSSDRRSVSGVQIPGANCNYGKLTIAGRPKVRLITEGGVSTWVIGYADPPRTNPNDRHGVVGQRVTIHTAGKTLPGRLDMIFAAVGNARTTDGDLIVGNCDVPFSAAR